MNWMTIPAMIGPTVGPIVGGFVTSYLSWRAIFYLNLPFGILGVALALWLVEDFRAPAPARFDLRGFFLAGIGLAVTRERVVNEEMGEDENFFMFRQAVICGGWIIAIPLLYIITDVNVVSRYMLLISPVIIVLAFSFLYHLMARLSVQRHLYTVIFLVTALVMLQNQFVYRKYVLPGIRTFEQGMETCLIPIATWLKDNGEPNSKVLIGDIGAVGYYSNQQICDAAGLITPSMLVFIRQGNQPYDIIEKKLYKGLCDVDFVVDRSLRAEDLKSDLTLIPLVSRPFFGMTISDTLVHYYTIYKVRKTSSQ